jgi:hypothetical protein
MSDGGSHPSDYSLYRPALRESCGRKARDACRDGREGHEASAALRKANGLDMGA